MTVHYVDITKEEFETWLNNLGQDWELKPGTKGCYLVALSERVAVHITSTLGDDTSVGYAKAAAQMRLVSRLTGRTLNKKAQGQKHFKRTSGWKQNWHRGYERIADAYQNSPEFYERIALAESDQEAEQEQLVNKLRGLWVKARDQQNDWAKGFLESIGKQSVSGKILSPKQMATVDDLENQLGVTE